MSSSWEILWSSQWGLRFVRLLPVVFAVMVLTLSTLVPPTGADDIEENAPESRAAVDRSDLRVERKQGGAGATVEAAGPSPVRTLSPEEYDLLARLVRAEAEAEPYEGKVAVAAVVLNRVDSGVFPDTVAGVIYQPRQFEPVQNGRIWRPARAVDRNAVQDALNGWDPTGGALYFFNPAKARSGFLWSRPQQISIGGHLFLR